MQLATTSTNQPWICNVWYALDKNGCVYWISRNSRRHSQQIHENGKAACTIHGQFNDGLGEKGQALIISGNAKLLKGGECEAAYSLYADRYPKIKEVQPLDSFQQNKGSQYFYVLEPQEIVWWDELNNPSEPRQVIYSL